LAAVTGDLSILEASIADAEELSALAIKTYVHSFGAFLVSLADYLNWRNWMGCFTTRTCLWSLVGCCIN
jgi:hypothetical protein